MKLFGILPMFARPRAKKTAEKTSAGSLVAPVRLPQNPWGFMAQVSSVYSRQKAKIGREEGPWGFRDLR